MQTLNRTIYLDFTTTFTYVEQGLIDFIYTNPRCVPVYSVWLVWIPAKYPNQLLV